MKISRDIHSLLNKITLVHDEHGFLKIQSLLKPENIGKPTRITFVNAHALNLCCKDSGFFRHILESDFIFRDGCGMKILYKMLGLDAGLNMNGTDLIPRIVDLYEGHNAALLGTGQPYLGRSARAVRQKGGLPVLLLNGFQKDEFYLKAARKNQASLIILAMGMPKQERVAALLAKNLDYPCLIICGGAILDFMGGKVARAPAIFRRLGMEWFYRLIHEPKRLFRRYVLGNFAFLFRGLVLTVSRDRKVS